MNNVNPKYLGWLKHLGIVSLGTVLLLAGFISIRLWLTLRQVPKPQAILILDGEQNRIQLAAQLAKQNPTLPVWVSGACGDRSQVKATFAAAELAANRVHYDLRATDTVTHFTTLVNDFARQDIQHLYVVTSEYHVARAETIAALVFGSRGIAISPISPAATETYIEETWLKVVRDGVRSLIWLGTGFSGAQLDPQRPRHASGSPALDSSHCVVVGEE